MDHLVFNKHSDIKLMPVRALSVYFGNSGDEYAGTFLNIYFLEKGSSLELKPITYPHYKGGREALGYNFNAKLIISQNEYDTNGLTDRLESLRKHTERNEFSDSTKRRDIQIMIGNRNPYPAGADVPPVINATDGIWIDLGMTCTLDYSIETMDYRPVCIIEINGFLKGPYYSLEPSSLYKVFN